MTENDQMKITEARNSFTGRTLTASQFDEAWAVAGVVNREIHKSGSFREKLGDYAHAFARTERFDQMKGEVILRDIYAARFGETMNQTREALMERENTIRETAREQALHHAQSIDPMIREGQTMPFYQAYDNAAVAMAQQHGITESGAKGMMKEAFREERGQELYDHGKAVEKQYHEPKREEARQAREAAREQSRQHRPAMQP